MNQLDLIAAITIANIFISLLLSSFLITVKSQYQLSNRLFATFLLLTTIDAIAFLIGSWSAIPPIVLMVASLVTFLQLPVFYLYVLSACYSDFQLKKVHLLHLIPFLVANLVLWPRFYGVGANEQLVFLSDLKAMWEIQFNHLLLNFQIATYLFIIFSVLKKVKRIYLQNYAGASLLSYHWLFQLTLALSIFYAIALLKNIVKFSNISLLAEWMTAGLPLAMLLIICWYLFKILNHPNLLRTVDSKLKLIPDVGAGKTHSSSVTEDLQKLKEHMAEHKPFLDPSLTIQQLSEAVEIPSRELSILINQQAGQHFFDFVNTYRIESAMELLKDPNQQELTVLEILYKVGFNSKSSFNTAFRKHTGTTPTLFRKSL